MKVAEKKSSPVLLSRRAVICSIFLLGLILRLFAWFLVPILKPDAVAYLQCAGKWAESGSLASDQPPLLLWLLKCMYQAGLDAAFWGILLNILFSMLFLVTLLKCLELLFPGQSLVPAILFFAAIHPTLILLSNQIMRDIPYCACMGLFAWRFLITFQKDLDKPPENDLYNAAVQGCILAVACFFRHEAFMGILFFLLYQAAIIFPSRKWKNCTRRSFTMLTAFAAVFLLLGMLTDFDKNWRNIFISQCKETFGLNKIW